MATAFVLIKTDLGKEEQLMEDIKKTESVVSVYMVYGKYDLIAKIDAKSFEKVKETITWKIRRMDNVKSTITMFATEI